MAGKLERGTFAAFEVVVVRVAVKINVGVVVASPRQAAATGAALAATAGAEPSATRGTEIG